MAEKIVNQAGIIRDDKSANVKKRIIGDHLIVRKPSILARRTSLWAVILCISLSIVYVLTESAAYSSTSIMVASDLVAYHHLHRIDDLYRPAHLILEPFESVIWALARLGGYVGGPLPVLLRINALCGGIGIGLLFLIFRAVLTRSRALAFLVPFALAFSFGYWSLATDGRPEMPGIAALIGAIYTLVRSMLTPNSRRIAIAGISGAIASLLYLPALLFLPVGILGILLAEYTQGTLAEEKVAKRRNLALYFICFLIPVIFAFLIVGLGIEQLTSIRDWFNWIQNAIANTWRFSPNFSSNLRLDAYGFRRALFAEPGNKTGTFHLQDSGSVITNMLYWTSLTGWFVATYAILSAVMFLVKTHYRSFLLIGIAIGVTYTSLFTFYNPGLSIEWVPVIVASTLILAVAMAYYRGRRYGTIWLAGLAVWIIQFTISNYIIVIKPNSEITSNILLSQANLIKSKTVNGDLIVVSGLDQDDATTAYIRYFTKRDVFSISESLSQHNNHADQSAIDLLGAVIQVHSSGHHVYALGDIWQDASIREELKSQYGLHSPQLLFNHIHRIAAWRDPQNQDLIVWKLVPAE